MEGKQKKPEKAEPRKSIHGERDENRTGARYSDCKWLDLWVRHCPCSSQVSLRKPSFDSKIARCIIDLTRKSVIACFLFPGKV